MYKRKLVIEKNLQAPVKKGEKIGYVSVLKNKKDVSRASLISNKDINSAN